jgi:hypothetical protein
MKKLLFVFLLPLSYCYPQTIGKFYFEEVVQVDSVSKDQLFNRAEQWFVQAFNTHKPVKTVNPEEGYITIESFYTVPVAAFAEPLDYCVNFKLSLYFKDNRYKYVATDFIFEDKWDKTLEIKGGPMDSEERHSSWIPKNHWIEMRQLAYNKAVSMIEGLKKSMLIAIETEKQDW